MLANVRWPRYEHALPKGGLNIHRCSMSHHLLSHRTMLLDSAVSINKFECPREKRFYLCTDTSRSHGHYPIRSHISINKDRARWQKTQSKGQLWANECTKTLMDFSVGHSEWPFAYKMMRWLLFEQRRLPLLIACISDYTIAIFMNNSAFGQMALFCWSPVFI